MTKEERLQKLMTSSEHITIAAIDHRGSLKEELHPNNPESTTEQEMLDWKKRMIELYKHEVSGLLIDPIYGAKLVDTNAPCSWMLSMEKTGYRGGKQARETEILENWSVEQAKEMGASGVKLLLYYDPRNQQLAEIQRRVAQRIADECKKEDVAFLLEPLSYEIQDSQRVDIVLQTARDLADIAVDIFKFEYPGTPEACAEITHIVPAPWVLLSAGKVYDQYKQALADAMKGGAAGFAVGRAVWQEFGKYQGEEREKYFTDVALPRMRELVQIVENI